MTATTIYANREVYHKRIKSSRNHKVAACSGLPQESHSKASKSPKPVVCSCNEKQVASYCQNHNDVICSECKALSHRSCKTSPIEEKSKELDFGSIGSTINRMNELRDKVTALQKSRKKDLISREEIANMCRDEVRAFRAEINTELDIMETNTLAVIDKYKEQQQEVIGQHIETCATGVKRLECSGRSLAEAKDASMSTQVFIYNLQLSKVIENLNTVVADINKEALKPAATFYRHADLIKSSTSYLGEVKYKSIPKPRKAIAEMQIAFSKEVNVKLSSDENPMITGSVFLPTGELLLCDNTNNNIKLLDQTLSLNKHLQLLGNPWGISNYDDRDVIITRPDDKILEFIRFFPTLESGRCIQLDKFCYGVAVHCDHIYVSFSDGEVRELDQNGIKKRSIGQISYGTPYFIAISENNKIYVGCANVMLVNGRE